MATVIRLKRGGRAHDAYYRLVVMDSRDRRQGRVIEEIGVYHPCARPEPRLDIDQAKALSWLGKGARVSDTVRTLFTQRGILAAFVSGAAAADAAPAAASAGGAAQA